MEKLRTSEWISSFQVDSLSLASKLWFAFERLQEKRGLREWKDGKGMVRRRGSTNGIAVSQSNVGLWAM